MTRLSRSVLLGGALTLAVAAPALAGVGYSVAIEQPAPDETGGIIVRGGMLVAVRAEGGLGDVEHAAFHVHRPGSDGWSEEDRVLMERVEQSLFRSSVPFPTGGLANGEYRLVARAWGETPSYDPRNPGSYARDAVTIVIDNPPEAPRASALTSVSSIRVSWRPVRSAERPDFAGYRIWAKHGRSCPADPSAYGFVAQTESTSWATVAARPGPYCLRVTAARSSEVSGVIDSAFSPPLPLVVPSASDGASGSGLVAGARGAPALPPAPSLVDTSPYDEALPYTDGPIQVELEQDPVDVAASAGVDRGTGTETARSIAAGLVLLVAAMHLRRFLSGVPRA